MDKNPFSFSKNPFMQETAQNNEKTFNPFFINIQTHCNKQFINNENINTNNQNRNLNPFNNNASVSSNPFNINTNLTPFNFYNNSFESKNRNDSTNNFKNEKNISNIPLNPFKTDNSNNSKINNMQFMNSNLNSFANINNTKSNNFNSISFGKNPSKNENDFSKNPFITNKGTNPFIKSKEINDNCSISQVKNVNLKTNINSFTGSFLSSFDKSNDIFKINDFSSKNISNPFSQNKQSDESENKGKLFSLCDPNLLGKISEKSNTNSLNKEIKTDTINQISNTNNGLNTINITNNYNTLNINDLSNFSENFLKNTYLNNENVNIFNVEKFELKDLIQEKLAQNERNNAFNSIFNKVNYVTSSNNFRCNYKSNKIEKPKKAENHPNQYLVHPKRPRIDSSYTNFLKDENSNIKNNQSLSFDYNIFNQKIKEEIKIDNEVWGKNIQNYIKIEIFENTKKYKEFDFIFDEMTISPSDIIYKILENYDKIFVGCVLYLNNKIITNNLYLALDKTNYIKGIMTANVNYFYFNESKLVLDTQFKIIDGSFQLFYGKTIIKFPKGRYNLNIINFNELFFLNEYEIYCNKSYKKYTCQILFNTFTEIVFFVENKNTIDYLVKRYKAQNFENYDFIGNLKIITEFRNLFQEMTDNNMN